MSPEEPPLVSIILPTYNRADLLKRAIASVLDQTFADFELIIVDDGSDSDPTPVVEAVPDARVRMVRHEENRGNAAARNTGIHLARGRYIAFLDDDDEWEPEKLALQVPVLEASEEDEALVYCGRRLVASGRLVRVDAPGKEGHVLDDLLPWGLMSCPSVVLKARVLDDVGLFDERLQRGVDADLWRRIARKYRVRYVDRVLVTCHVGHAERVTVIQTQEHIRQDIHRWLTMLHGFQEELEARPASHAIVLRRLGERYVQAGERTTGLRYMMRSIVRNPLRPDTYGMLVASLFGRRGLDSFLRFKERIMAVVRRARSGRVGARGSHDSV